MDFVNNLNAVVGEYIHLFNQQIGQFEGQHIRFCNRVNDFLSAALAGLFFSLQPCLGGDSSIGIFDFQYFCVINCFLRFICVQLDLPQEIPFKESLLLVLQNFQLLLILRAFDSGGLQVNGAVLMYGQQDFQLLFQSEEDGFFQPSNICPDIAAATVHISGRMAAHIKRSLLGDAGECMIAAATIDLAFQWVLSGFPGRQGESALHSLHLFK